MPPAFLSMFSDWKHTAGPLLVHTPARSCTVMLLLENTPSSRLPRVLPPPLPDVEVCDELPPKLPKAPNMSDRFWACAPALASSTAAAIAILFNFFISFVVTIYH